MSRSTPSRIESLRMGRVQLKGDRLTIAPRNYWFRRILCSIWLPGWTAVGLVAFFVLLSGQMPWKQGLFTACWLIFWYKGLCHVGFEALWVYFGREWLEKTPTGWTLVRKAGPLLEAHHIPAEDAELVCHPDEPSGRNLFSTASWKGRGAWSLRSQGVSYPFGIDLDLEDRQEIQTIWERWQRAS